MMTRLGVQSKAEYIAHEVLQNQSSLTDRRLAALQDRHGNLERVVAASLAVEFLEEAAENLREDIDDGEYGTEGE